MFAELNSVMILIFAFTFMPKPSLQQLGEWKLTKFELMEIFHGSVTMIKSSSERKYEFVLFKYITYNYKSKSFLLRNV